MRHAARAALEEAERLNRRKADAQASTFAVSVGMEKLKAGNRGGAIEQFREAIRLAADNPQAHYQLALALGQTAPDEARRHFEDARRLAPYLRPPGAPAAECAGRTPRLLETTEPMPRTRKMLRKTPSLCSSPSPVLQRARCWKPERLPALPL